jgi:hypothetical protein
MRGFSWFLGVIATASLCSASAGQSQNVGAPSAQSETVAKQDGCEVYFALQPIEPSAVRLLATPIVPANRTVFADASIRQLQDWDLPSKVAAWRDRPSPEDLARQWDELSKKWSPGAQNKDKSKSGAAEGHTAPYAAYRLPAKEWQDLEKWFGKTAPKKVSGLCVDQGKATYVLAIGFISGGAEVSGADPNRVGEYTDYASKPQVDSLGPNAGTVAPHITPSDEFSGTGSSKGVPGNTCVYLYRTNGKALGAGGARQEAPEYYYCHAGSGISQSTATTMLKYLSKTGLK